MYASTVVSRYTEPIGALETRSVYPEVRFREYDSVTNMSSVTRQNRSVHPEVRYPGSEERGTTVVPYYL